MKHWGFWLQNFKQARTINPDNQCFSYAEEKISLENMETKK